MSLSNDFEEHQQRGNNALYEFSDRIVTMSMGLLAISVTFRSSVIGNNPDAIWLV
jgi:hypothetical protein